MKLKHTLIACSIMLFSFFFLGFINKSEDIRPNKRLITFPTEIAGWQGKVDYFDDRIYNVLGVDDSFFADYRNAEGKYVNLYIGFYQSQREGDLIHSPKNCMPGGGWNITRNSLIDIDFPGREGNTKVIKLDLQNGPFKQVVLYWYHSRGRIINSEYWQKIYLVTDSITKRRTDGSFVRLITPVVGDNDEAAIEDLKEFAKLIFPIIEEYLPS